MSFNYIEYDFKTQPVQPTSEILIAELAEVGFESFEQTEQGVRAYIREKDWNEEILADIFALSSPEFSVSYQMKKIPAENWNQKWEENFSPIQVEGICTVRATFHPPANTEYEIIIDPKMSFGTGHHQTTYMMLQYLLETDLQGKSILDMGCGTGILAIMAAKKGAKPVLGIDVDPWCVENALENIKLNQADFIQIQLGDASLISGSYDVILANINRNILLEDIPTYAQHLQAGGGLLLSGFYQEDLPMISEKCLQQGLSFQGQKQKDDWVSAVYKKIP